MVSEKRVEQNIQKSCSFRYSRQFADVAIRFNFGQAADFFKMFLGINKLKEITKSKTFVQNTAFC